MTLFDHERMDVYQAAIRFVALADDLVEAMPQGRSCLADQLHRASISIALNIAEGAGEFSKNDKARFYRMALRSATECAAILDVEGFALPVGDSFNGTYSRCTCRLPPLASGRGSTQLFRPTASGD